MKWQQKRFAARRGGHPTDLNPRSQPRQGGLGHALNQPCRCGQVAGSSMLQVKIFESCFDNNILECSVSNAKGHSRQCARHAAHHIERALIVKEIDPEMAVFRTITAEDKAATAIFFGLKEQGYQNAEKDRFKNHAYMQALEPILRGISSFI